MTRGDNLDIFATLEKLCLIFGEHAYSSESSVPY
jgi:hypothetical protein